MRQVVAAVLGFTASFLLAQDLPPNTWVTAGDETTGGAAVGLVYLPEQKGMLQFGRRDGKGATNYWAEVFDLAGRRWQEWVPSAGRLSAQNSRGSCYTQWTVKDGYAMPVLPCYNNCFWAAHQMCYLPEEKKVLYFWGGLTFTYDPAARAFENKGIPLDQAPPDVMLGSMAWDPVNREAVLFGGGYLKAYQVPAITDVKQVKQPGAWTPDRWDRRGTWAYDPAKNAWHKQDTASKEVADANARLVAAGVELRTLWGATRGVAFEYGDLVLAKKPAELGALVGKLGEDLAAFASDNRGKGAEAYERWQFATAAGLIEKAIVPRLQEASAALKMEDGWKAFQALDDAEKRLIEAQEALAVAPRPRHYTRLVADPENKVMVLWGGDGEDRFFADTWLLHLNTRRWERCRTAVHPPNIGSAMVAMDYDARNKVVVLAHQDGSLWLFDASKRAWRQAKMAGEFARKGRGSTWLSLEYAPAADVHVLTDCGGSTMNPNSPPRKTQMLRLDLASAAMTDASSGTLEEVWRGQYGAGCEGPADKVAIAWSFMPKTQAEYRERVASNKKALDAIPDNTWTQLKAPYSSFGRAYGSFCYDWDRDEIFLWGGGHSAYMGNEWSQYDLKANVWMESWNPEFPVHPHGSPDGEGWAPQFYNVVGAGHGYHNYAYSGGLRKAIMSGTVLYDPDRMRYAPERIAVTHENAMQGLGIRVDMSGAPETLSVSAQHWYGGPFGVWRVDTQALTCARIKGSDTPFETNDRAKAVFDTKRQRVLFYGATNSKEKGGKSNALWAYGMESRAWQKIEPKVEPDGAEAPVIGAWNYCYSPKHDGLLIPSKTATWFYDCANNVMKKLDCKPVGTEAGVIYSPRQDLFYMLDGDGYHPQKVWVFRFRP